MSLCRYTRTCITHPFVHINATSIFTVTGNAAIVLCLCFLQISLTFSLDCSQRCLKPAPGWSAGFLCHLPELAVWPWEHDWPMCVWESLGTPTSTSLRNTQPMGMRIPESFLVPQGAAERFVYTARQVGLPGLSPRSPRALLISVPTGFPLFPVSHIAAPTPTMLPGTGSRRSSLPAHQTLSQALPLGAPEQVFHLG